MLINQIKNKEYLAKGKRGVVHVGTITDAKNSTSIKIAIKEKNPNSEAQNRILIESHFLQKLNKHNIGPKYLESGENYMMYEFVEGIFIIDYLKQATKTETIDILKKVFEQMYTLDKLGINKEEMTHPVKHVIVKQNKDAVMIDFERCNHTIKPKNVTQFCQFITSSNIEPILKDKDVQIKKEDIIHLAQEYKNKICDKTYSDIIKKIK